MSRVRLIVAALAVAAAAVAVGAVAGSDDLVRPAAQAGVLGWIALAAALLWRPAILAPAMVGLALPVAITVLGGSAHAGPVVGATVLLVATGELAGWAIDRRSIVPEGGGLAVRRAGTTVGLAAGAAVVSGGVLAASDLPAPGGSLPALAGTAAALAVLALAALRRW